MDAENILDGLLRGALGGRGKRSRGTRRAIGRRGSLVNAGTLLAAAGVAWGAYEAWQGQRVGGKPVATPPSAPPAVPPIPGRAGEDTVPPLPDAAGSTPVLSEPVLRLVRLMISAAGADGHLGPEEREQILAEARRAGAEDVVKQELGSPMPLADIVGDVTDPELKEQLYTLAFSVVRADETVTGGERVYLAGLAHQLGLEADDVSRLEEAAAASIDAASLEPDARGE
jgi:uncharacterized membrane protein YebE (DUF533 family)